MKYFAYGTLLDRATLRKLCPGAEPLQAARISNHRVAFTGRSSRWGGGGTSTIRLAVGSEVWGGIYEVDDACQAAIVASASEDGYVWAWTQVETDEGERVRVGLLVRVRDLEENEPSPAYMEAVRKALRAWGLSEAGLGDGGGDESA